MERYYKVGKFVVTDKRGRILIDGLKEGEEYTIMSRIDEQKNNCCCIL